MGDLDGKDPRHPKIDLQRPYREVRKQLSKALGKDKVCVMLCDTQDPTEACNLIRAAFESIVRTKKKELEDGTIVLYYKYF